MRAAVELSGFWLDGQLLEPTNKNVDAYVPKSHFMGEVTTDYYRVVIEGKEMHFHLQVPGVSLVQITTERFIKVLSDWDDVKPGPEKDFAVVYIVQSQAWDCVFRGQVELVNCSLKDSDIVSAKMREVPYKDYHLPVLDLRASNVYMDRVRLSEHGRVTHSSLVNTVLDNSQGEGGPQHFEVNNSEITDSEIFGFGRLNIDDCDFLSLVCSYKGYAGFHKQWLSRLDLHVDNIDLAESFHFFTLHLDVVDVHFYMSRGQGAFLQLQTRGDLTNVSCEDPAWLEKLKNFLYKAHEKNAESVTEYISHCVTSRLAVLKLIEDRRREDV